MTNQDFKGSNVGTFTHNEYKLQLQFAGFPDDKKKVSISITQILDCSTAKVSLNDETVINDTIQITHSTIGEQVQEYRKVTVKDLATNSKCDISYEIVQSNFNEIKAYDSSRGTGDYDTMLIALDSAYTSVTHFRIKFYQEIHAARKIVTYHEGKICDLASEKTGRCI